MSRSIDPSLLTQDSTAGELPGDGPRLWVRVSHRAAGVAPVFTRDERFDIFTEAMAQARDASGMRLCAFSVLPRRYNLLLNGTPAQIEHGVRELVSVFTQWIRLDEGSRGPVFTARTQRAAIERRGLSNALEEIHLAPVVDGVVDLPEGCDWSSYRCFIGLESPPSWLDVDEVLFHVGGKVAHRDSVTDRFMYREVRAVPISEVPLELPSSRLR